jgi:hypothetical protein
MLSPMEKENSPEIAQSKELGTDGVSLYQSLISVLQWAVTLGRFDIFDCYHVHVAFNINPRVGHLERLKQVFGYLKKSPDARICFRTGLPKNEELFEVPDHD